MKLKVKDLYFSYDSVDVLEDVIMEVGRGETVNLVGPNGSGKSTLLKCINMILKPKRGTVLVKESDIKRSGLKELARMMGYVPQSAGSSLPSTVFDAVLLGRKPHMGWGVSKRDKEIVSDTLELLGLGDMAMRQFNELSGGERQKVVIARALAQEPEILLLDEPTSNLDLRHQLEVLKLISSAVREKGVSAVTAMHDLNLASRFSDKVLFLKEGKVYDVGKPQEVLNSENIKAVYGVETIINKDSGIPHIIPLGVAE